MLGINIKVDSKQVQDAKRQIEMLNQAMNDTDSLGDLTIGAGASQEVKQLAEEIQKLKRIASQGDNKGGILNRQQFQDAQRLMNQINQGIQNYARQLRSVRDEYKQINQEQSKLAMKKHTGTASTEELDKFKRNKTRMQELAEERRELEARRQRMTAMGASASNAAGRIGGMSEHGSGGAGGAGMAGMMARGGMWGMAAGAAMLGVGSILGFISGARGMYAQAAGHEARLGGRGVRGGWGGASSLGYNPIEYMGLMEHMSTQGVLSKDVARSTRFAASMSKAYGMDPSQVTGLYGTMYQATGNAQNATSAILMIESIKKGMDKTRMPELLNLVARNTNTTAQALGGAAMTRSQLNSNIALSAATMNLKDGDPTKQYMKSEAFSRFMQSGLQSAGTPLGEIWLNMLIGRFDRDKQLTYGRDYQLKKIQREGFKEHPKYLQQMYEDMQKIGLKDDESKAGYLGRTIPDALAGVDPMALVKFMQSDALKDFIAMKEKLGNKAPTIEADKATEAKYRKEYNAMAGASKEKTTAQWAQLQLDLGDKLWKTTAHFEAEMVKLMTKFIDSEFFNQALGVLKGQLSILIKLSEWFANPTKKAAEELKKTAFENSPYALTQYLGRKMSDLIPDDVHSKKTYERSKIDLKSRLEQQIGGVGDVSSGHRPNGWGLGAAYNISKGKTAGLGNLVDPFGGAHEAGRAMDILPRVDRKNLGAVLKHFNTSFGINLTKDQKGNYRAEDSLNRYLIEHTTTRNKQTGEDEIKYYLHMEDRRFQRKQIKDKEQKVQGYFAYRDAEKKKGTSDEIAHQKGVELYGVNNKLETDEAAYWMQRIYEALTAPKPKAPTPK